jgi:hypothetical protein
MLVAYAIKMRYEKEAEAEGVDVKKLAAEQTREIEELEETLSAKKISARKLWCKGLLMLTRARLSKSSQKSMKSLIEVGMGGKALKEHAR